MSIGHRVIFERDVTQTELPWDYGAAVAQGTHNPLVVGSNPSGPIFILDNLPFWGRLFFYGTGYSKSLNILSSSNIQGLAMHTYRLAQISHLRLRYW